MKSGKVTFDPPLPPKKAMAFRALEMGVLDKVYLRFAEAFWPKETEVFGRIAQGGEFVAMINTHFHGGPPILLCFLAGTAARRIEELADDEIARRARARLAEMFGEAPAPEAVMVTRWGNDPFALGSYSHVPPGATPGDRLTIAEPVGDRLYFAGEATERDYPATIRGALVSGRREADRILSQ